MASNNPMTLDLLITLVRLNLVENDIRWLYQDIAMNECFEELRKYEAKYKVEVED